MDAPRYKTTPSSAPPPAEATTSCPTSEAIAPTTSSPPPSTSSPLGVDVPSVRNVVFFRYVGSPIAFYQMVGRGTRLDPSTQKLMFRVFDYTDATRLFGERMKTALAAGSAGDDGGGPDDGDDGGEDDGTMTVVVHDMDVRITNAGTLIMTTNEEGREVPITLDEYKQRLAARLVEDIPALDAFRDTWVDPNERRHMMGQLPDGGRAPLIVRQLDRMEAYDLYDVLAEVGYGQSPKNEDGPRRSLRKHAISDWLSADMSPPAAEDTVRAIASQFALGGTDESGEPAAYSASKA